MGLLDSVKELQNMAKQAKNIAGQLKNMLGEQSQTPTKTSCIPNSKEIASEQNQTIYDASGRLVIQSEVQMEAWLSSISTKTQSPAILKIIDAQMQVIKFVKAPSLLGMVLDNMIAVLYQTLREASSSKEKTDVRETISLMIQNLIFLSDAQLHYAIDRNKQEAKQLLSTAGDILAKSVALAATLAAGPTVAAGVVIKNIFATEEMQNGFFGRLIGWIIDKQQIEQRKEDFNIALKNLFDTFDKYSTLIGPSIQIHGMLHRYEKPLVSIYSSKAYASLYHQFIKDMQIILDDFKFDDLEAYNQLEALLVPLKLSSSYSSRNSETGLIQEFVTAFVGKNALSSNNVQQKANVYFNYTYLCDICSVMEQKKTKLGDQIESLNTQIASLSFMKISAKKELEQQKKDAEKELNFCKKILTKIEFYSAKAKNIDSDIQTYSNSMSATTAKFILDLSSMQETKKEEPDSSAARQKFDKMWEMALTDGEITEKEINILWRYAEAAGIDEGEFELMIENKVNMK